MAPVSGSAANVNSGELEQACLGENRSLEDAFCNGYFLALSESIAYGTAMSSTSPYETTDLWGVCAPTNVGPQQLRRVWMKYISDHPEEHHLLTYSTAMSAFREAWPCLEQSTKSNDKTR
jgi:hypothetical protein